MKLLLTVESAPLPAAECMARDAELLASAASCGADDVLARLYDWSSPAVSLPKSASLSGASLKILAAAGIEVVNRPTGGAPLIHGSQNT